MPSSLVPGARLRAVSVICASLAVLASVPVSRQHAGNPTREGLAAVGTLDKGVITPEAITITVDRDQYQRQRRHGEWRS